MRIFLTLFIVVAFLASCKGSHASSSAEGEGEVLPMKYAENLTVREFPDFTEVTVRNPWDTLKTLQKYILVERDSEMPAGLPEGTIIKVPVTNALVYSTVHNSLITELGAIDAIGGICNSKYVNGKELQARLASGRIVDCGVSLSPDLEKIIKLKPQVIMLSPFENNDKYAKVGELGIPIIECADYMETSPLARAEWMILYGMLFDREEEARRLFDATEREYNALKNLTEGVADRPKVLVDRLYGQAWYVPAANSTMGIFIKDAGGENPFAVHDRNGSVGLAGEQVLYQAEDADVWLMRYAQDSDKTMRELASDNAIYTQFKAFKDNRVYGCNTSRVFFYEDIPFHPQWLLRDMISILHPGLVAEKEGKKYFTQLEQ